MFVEKLVTVNMWHTVFSFLSWLVQALIQTCLNSPENGVITQHDLENDRRMNPNGFEETELCYAAAAEDDEGADSAEVDTF